MPLFFILLLIPITEIFLFATFGAAIGPWMTLGLVFLTAFIGISVFRYQGIATLKRAKQRLHKGELPDTELMEALLLGLGGILLLLPGFFTDFIGFCLLLPLSRRWLSDTSGHLFSKYLSNKHSKKPFNGQFSSSTAEKKYDLNSQDATAQDASFTQTRFRSQGFSYFSRKRTDEACSRSTHKHKHTIEGKFRRD